MSAHLVSKLAVLALLVVGLAACQSGGGAAPGAAPGGSGAQRPVGSSEGGGY